MTYEELKRFTDSWAVRFREKGIRPGDRIALLLFDSPEFIACFLAAARLGAISVPMSTFLTREDAEFIVSDSAARLVIAEPELVEKMQRSEIHNDAILIVRRDEYFVGSAAESSIVDLPDAETRADTPCFLLYTSGSTGRPKGVLHVHGSIPCTVENYSSAVLKLGPNDRLFSSSRLFFAYGLGNSLSFPLAAGATVILEANRPTPELISRILENEEPTVFFGVPAVYNALLQFQAAGGKLNLSSVRLCVSAGEALPEPVFDAWRQQTGLAILDGIGSTEMLHIFISNREEHARGGSSGTAVPGYETRLLSAESQEISRGDIGNLWVKGGSTFACYWNLPELSSETIRDSWVRTGDLYKQDEEGYFYHVGRSDDCFKVRGLWVSPVEVESALLESGEVIEAAVVPAIDSAGLATVKAFVVIRDKGAGEDILMRLRSALSSKLPQYKVPAEVELIDSMPRTATGKIQRFKLRSAKTLAEL